MDLINIIPVSGAAGVFIAIVAMLALLSGIGILIRKVNKGAGHTIPFSSSCLQE